MKKKLFKGLNKKNQKKSSYRKTNSAPEAGDIEIEYTVEPDEPKLGFVDPIQTISQNLPQQFAGRRIFSLKLGKTKYGKLSKKQKPVTLQVVPEKQMATISRMEMQKSASLSFRERNRQKDQKLVRMAICAVVALAVLIGGGCGIGYLIDQNRTCYSLAVDGEEMLLFPSEQAAKKALENYAYSQLPEGADGIQTDYKQQVAVVSCKAKGREFSSEEEIQNTLTNKVQVMVLTKAITVDGEAVAALLSEDAALGAINDVKEHYFPDNDNIIVTDAKFREQVAVTDYWCPTAWVKTREQAVASILGGANEDLKHTVANGESLWTIAKKYNTTVAALQEANPSIDPARLHIGQEIRLTQYKPIVRVVLVLEVTQNNVLPYQTKYVNDSSILRGKETVKTEGKNGEEKVTYQIVQENGNELSRMRWQTTIIAEAQDKVVQRGTKLVVASRGNGGSLAWPKSGSINSRYGGRSGGFHTGIDISGRTGDSVRAAAGGTVISAGWSGGYGNCVKIDHGGGVVTLYAHMSKIKVSKGDTLSTGDLVGLVGSTGNSTGSHLHFEVRINGKHVNPLNYLP